MYGKASAVPLLVRIACCLLAAVALELAIFNFDTALSLGNHEVTPTSQREFERGGDTYREYTFSPSRIGNVRIKANLPQDFEGTSTLTISVQDEGNENLVTLNQGQGDNLYFSRDSTFTLEIFGRVRKILIRMDPVVPKSALDLNSPDAKVRARSSEAYPRLYQEALDRGMDAEAAARYARDEALHGELAARAIPFTWSASFNVVRPLDVSGYRVALMCAVLFAASWLLPGSRLWRERCVGTRFPLLVAVGGAAAICLLVAAHLGFVAAGDQNERQYLELAQALAQGHLYLDAKPSPELLAMDNPYDSIARSLSGVPFLWDHAYYQGRYYVYFGVLPALVYHLPFYLVTGQMFPNALADALSGSLLAGGSALLLRVACRRWFSDVSKGVFLTAYLALLLGSWAPFVGMYPGHYVLPIVTGLACLVWGVALWVRATTRGTAPGPISVPHAVAGSLLVALTLASRPQLIVGGCIGIVLIVQSIREHGWRACLRPTLLALVPFALVAFAVGWYNAARFGSPLDFGANYNLTGDDMTHRGFAITRLAPGVFSYLLQSPAVASTHPFLRSVPLITNTVTLAVTEPMQGGIVPLVPLLVAPAALLVRDLRRRVPEGIPPLVIACAAIAPVIAAFDANGAGILPRYLLDFGFFLAFAAALVLLALGEGEGLVRYGDPASESRGGGVRLARESQGAGVRLAPEPCGGDVSLASEPPSAGARPVPSRLSATGFAICLLVQLSLLMHLLLFI